MSSSSDISVRRILTVMILPVVIPLLLIIGVVSAVVSTEQAVYNAAACTVGFAAAPLQYAIDKIDDFVDGSGNHFSLTREQADNAALIVGFGATRHEDPDRQAVLIAAALVESGLRNLPYGDRDSLGLFQMRPSIIGPDSHPYWGTSEQIMNPTYSINRMYDELDRKVPNLAIMTIGQAAQAIEVSALPDRYAKVVGHAQAIVKAAVPETGRKVTLVGDSLTAGMDQIGNVKQQLKLAGWTDATVDGVVSRHISSTPPQSGLQALAQLASQPSPDGWIIELGTNDLASLTSQTEAESLINQLLDNLGPSTRVLWVNSYMLYRGDQAKLFNTALQTVAAQRHNVQIADWNSYLTDNQDLLLPDGVHLSNAGYAQMAYFVAQASVGLRDSPVIPTPTTSSSFMSRTCKTGKKILDFALGFIEAQEGWPFRLGGLVSGIGKSVAPSISLFRIAFQSAGYDLPDTSTVLPAGESIIDYSAAERGDLVYWDNPAQPANPIRGIYLGRNQVIIEPALGEVVTVTPMNWVGVTKVIRLDIPDSSPDAWQSPLHDHYTITSGFGMRTHPITHLSEMHDGIDIAAAAGTEVYAPAAGTVTRVEHSPLDGAWLAIDHGGGVESFYFDLAETAPLSVGQTVTAGQRIGTIGDCRCTGSTGDHVHLRVHVGGQPYDPIHFFQERGVSL